MNLKERIVNLCKERDITVSKLENDLGFAGGYISKLNKSTPNTDKINQIANYFSVSLDYLVNGKEETYTDESAHLVAKIRKDTKLSKALLKYFELSDVKKNHVIELINLLSEV